MEEKKWKIDNNKWIGVINVITLSRYDENGIDKHGFNREGIHVITGTKFDENGYDRFGFNEEGVNKHGINISGRFENGYSVKYIKNLYGRLARIMEILASDKILYSMYSEKFPILILKQNERVFDKNGIDQHGFNKKEIHVISKSTTDKKGYNSLGYCTDGYDREGYDREGYDIKGYSKENIDRNGKKDLKKN